MKVSGPEPLIYAGLVSTEPVRTKKRGRPRKFDADQLLDSTVDTFWKHGLAGTTTRVLEDTLGVSQSSLYNAFGSKDQLLNQAIARYESGLQTAVLDRLSEPSRDTLLDFVDAIIDWVSNPEHPGCLVMNLASEHPDHAWRLETYRVALTDGIGDCLATFVDPKEVRARADLLAAAFLGLNLSAKCGTPATELTRAAAGIKAQIASW